MPAGLAHILSSKGFIVRAVYPVACKDFPTHVKTGNYHVVLAAGCDPLPECLQVKDVPHACTIKSFSTHWLPGLIPPVPKVHPDMAPWWDKPPATIRQWTATMQAAQASTMASSPPAAPSTHQPPQHGGVEGPSAQRVHVAGVAATVIAAAPPASPIVVSAPGLVDGIAAAPPAGAY